MQTFSRRSIQAEHMVKAAEILKTMAHPVRLQIIDLLEGGEKTVGELSLSLSTPQPYMSQQLNLMKAKAILGSRREGNQVYYCIANPNVVKIIHCISQQGEEGTV